MTGNYYPRYRCTGNMETGSGHVSYLSRPYYSYKVPSRYGFSNLQKEFQQPLFSRSLRI